MSEWHVNQHNPPTLYRSTDPDEELLYAQSPATLTHATPISSVWIACLTYFTSLRVTVAHLITFETVFVSLISAGSVLFYSFTVFHGDLLVARISLTFLSTIIIFPITANIGYAFGRREKALQALAAIKVYVMHIYVAHRDWAFDAAGKKCAYSGRNILNVTLSATLLDEEEGKEESQQTKNGKDGGGWDVVGGVVSQQHTNEVRFVMIKLIRAMRDFLALPLANRSRHLYTASGRRTRSIVRPVQHACLQDFYEQLQRLTLAVERMKEAGLPGNEAARINQYHTLLMKEWEDARNIKSYRTPTGLRAFARLYILVHPLFAGPYYAWVAGAGLGEDGTWPSQTSIAFAVCLAVFTGLALQGLFNVEVGMEDPFDEIEGLDNVQVHKFFRETERIISMEWAPHVWNDTVMRGKSLVDAEFSQVLASVPKDIPRPGLLDAQAAMKKDLNPFSWS